MTDNLPLLFFAGVASGMLTWIVLHRLLLKNLARDHAAFFPQTQSRPVFQQGAMMQFFFICEFLLKKTYARLGDTRITTLSIILKALTPLIILCFLGMMLSPMLVEVMKR